jgi:uncharacterized protein (DUF1800 family)
MILKQSSYTQTWSRYKPRPEAPWDLGRVVHLHRRAGFGATWSEMTRDLRDGPEASINRVVAGKARANGVPDDFSEIANKLVQSAGGNIRRLQAWWFYRMVAGPDPLAERLALFWHDNFATSAAKVGATVLGQNEIFRELGRAPYRELLTHVVHDPAMLLWLDAPENTKGHPNENLARELLELFTIGVGHYTESDVKVAARALTGWTIDGGRFHDDPTRHDDGEKSILGRAGPWRGDDLVRMLVDHPATARRLAERICRLFLGEAPVSDMEIETLSAGLRERQLDVGWAVETVLRSERFFAATSLNQRVSAPAEVIVGAVRSLELIDPFPDTMTLAEWTTTLGQDLFHPPNVGGWPGGRAWLTTQGVIGRARFASDLIAGRPVGLPGPVDVVALAEKYGRSADLDDQVSFYVELITGRRPGRSPSDRLLEGLRDPSANRLEAARRALIRILASPEAQLT